MVASFTLQVNELGILSWNVGSVKTPLVECNKNKFLQGKTPNMITYKDRRVHVDPQARNMVSPQRPGILFCLHLSASLSDLLLSPLTKDTCFSCSSLPSSIIQKHKTQPTERSQPFFLFLSQVRFPEFSLPQVRACARKVAWQSIRWIWKNFRNYCVQLNLNLWELGLRR